MLRLITSVNWLIAAVALIGALGWPFVQSAWSTSSTRTAAEALASSVWVAQQRVHAQTGRYVYFAGTEMQQGAGNLDLQIDSRTLRIDAISEPGNALVMRVYPDPNALTAGKAPPFLYRLEVRESGGDARPMWEPLSGRTPGILDWGALL